MREITFFFFNDTATTEIYTLSLHDALPIFGLLLTRDTELHAGRIVQRLARLLEVLDAGEAGQLGVGGGLDRKSTRLNSSHPSISYAVFCLKKKKKHTSSHHVLWLNCCRSNI